MKNLTENLTASSIDATPSNKHLVAWPTLTQAAPLIGVSLSTVSRVVKSKGIVEHRLGGQTKKLDPCSVLDLALEYGADPVAVADRLYHLAKDSGVDPAIVLQVEESLGQWFANQARNAAPLSPERLDELVQAVKELSDPEVAAAILARAGIEA